MLVQFWELSKSLVPTNHELYSRSCDFLYKYKAKQYTENLMPQSYKTQIKIHAYPGLA